MTDPRPDCPVCGPGPQAVVVRIGRGEVRGCRRCALGWTWPVPAAALDPRGSYDHELWHTAVDRFELHRGYARPIVDEIRRRVSGGRLLEIGSNVGALLSVARDEGFAVEGLEVNPGAAGYARERLGIHTHVATLEEVDLPPRSYEAIVANHTLEHIVDVKGMLAKVLELLLPGGVLLVVSPNHRGLIARLQGVRWAGWQIQQHAWHFSIDGLAGLLRGAGYVGADAWAPMNMDHPVGPGLRGRLKRAVLWASEVLGWADQVYGVGFRGHL